MVMIFNEKNEQFYCTILQFPMPPTSNKQLTRARFGNRFIKTTLARSFDSTVDLYQKQHGDDFARLSVVMEQFKMKGFGFKVDTTFYFPREKLLTKKDILKKIDASNRIKATHDAIARLTNIDDQYFISGSFDKQVSPNDGSSRPEFSNIKISLIKWKY
jgi:hypothetical protein